MTTKYVVDANYRILWAGVGAVVVKVVDVKVVAVAAGKAAAKVAGKNTPPADSGDSFCNSESQLIHNFIPFSKYSFGCPHHWDAALF